MLAHNENINNTIEKVNEGASFIQQAITNALDSWNVDLQKRGIGKQYHIDMRYYDANHSVIIGANKKKEIKLEFKFILQTLDKKGSLAKEGVLYTVNFKPEVEPDGETITETNAMKAVDQVLMMFMKECIGLFALVSEQRIKQQDGGHANG